MEILVIAEKPSVGRLIAAALSPDPEKCDGYIDCGTVRGGHVLVSWAQGHLVDLADPQDYGERWRSWSLDTLPVDPGAHWKWCLSTEKGAAARYRALLPLMRRADMLVDACDPDREGEGIFTRIVSYAGLSGKPARRLWANSMDADGLRKAWDGLEPEEEYRGLAAASDARAKADWMLGMTASRAYSLLYDTHASVGRVESPTLAMIVTRDRRIRNHVATPFWTVTIPLAGWSLVSPRFDSQRQAEEAAARVGDTVTVTDVRREEKKLNPPTLYDLTGLQRDANRIAGLTAGQTLDALQCLYEKGLATYPRTDSRYVTSDDLEDVRRLLASPAIRCFAGDKDPGEPDPARVVNDKKVEGHTALLPTTRLTPGAYRALEPREQKVIALITNRLWQATGSPRRYETTRVEADVNGTRYTAFSERTLDEGWTRFLPHHKEDKTEIPGSLNTGDGLRPSDGARVTQGATKPPAPFTDASLLAMMEHASRQVDDKDLKAALDDDSVHSGGIGTPATRAAVIDKIIKRGYAARHGRQIRATETGETLCDMLAPDLLSVEATARMEQGLTDIAQGRLDEQTWLDRVSRQTSSILPAAREAFDPALARKAAGMGEESLGPCPLCGSPVVKTRGGYWKCSANRSVKGPDGQWGHRPGSCTYGIFRKSVGNNRKKLTDSLVARMLAGKKPRVRNAVHSNKTGKDYDLLLVPDTKWGVKGVFPGRRK